MVVAAADIIGCSLVAIATRIININSSIVVRSSNIVPNNIMYNIARSNNYCGYYMQSI